MNTQFKVLIAVVALAISFASGRFLSPTKTRTETKVVEVEKVVVKVEHVVTTIRENPDGTKETIIVADTKTDSQSSRTVTDSIKEVIGKRNTLNVSVLAGIQLPLNTSSLVYGASLTKEVLGPITIGGWALTNKTVGISVGLNF